MSRSGSYSYERSLNYLLEILNQRYSPTAWVDKTSASTMTCDSAALIV
jgi:hypothetical protein